MGDSLGDYMLTYLILSEAGRTTPISWQRMAIDIKENRSCHA